MQKGTVLSRLALAGALIVGALPALAQNATTPAAKLDIAGVRIGMTEAEAVKAVQAFDASAKLKRNLATFPYFDGVNSLESPEFLDQIGVTMAGSGIGIWFASPPAEPRAGPDEVVSSAQGDHLLDPARQHRARRAGHAAG